MNNAPSRFNDGASWNRGMQEAELSLSKIRENNEKRLTDVKMSNLKKLFESSKKGSEEVNKLDLDLAKKTNNYRIELVKKYGERYAGTAKDNAEIEKKIQKQVLDYISVEKQKRRAQEKTEEMQQAFDVRNAKLKADLDIHAKRLQLIKEQQQLTLQDIEKKKKANLQEFQSGKKSFKDYMNYRKKLNADEEKAKKKTAKAMRKAGASELDIMQETKKISGKAVGEAVFSKETASAIGNNLLNGLKQMFDNTIQTYGQYQTKINTRIQGSGNSWNGFMGIGGIESKIKYSIGANPYVKLQAVMDNVVKATEQGIAFNIEQRAFLGTIKDSIATTFDAFDSNLSRIIRMQQADSTAARLGLEAGLTSFFNSMYEDSSYLDSAFDTVSQNLIETTSQLGAESAVELEYVIQKWLGSLYSVGFSDTAVGKISQALGYLGSGNVSALSSDTEMQNLIVMAASRANMSYSDMLIDGLDASKTNKLMQSMVQYLEEIATSDNKVVKSEYARIFGMSVSDLKAVTNVASDLSTIAGSMMSYGGAINELYSQMGQLVSRTSVAGMMQNLFDNVNYSIGTTIASNPVTYALWQITSMIEDLTGGIALPTFSVMGNMVDLNTTVTNLMRAGIVGVGSLGAIGSMISGLSSTFAPGTMLSKLGIVKGSGAQTTARGAGLSRKSKQVQEQSSSAYVGNTSGEDYYASTTAAADDEVDKKAKQKQEESKDVNLNNIHEYLLTVFDPKLTEIEKLVAIMAGYQVQEKGWTNSSYGHSFGEGKKYSATTTVVVGLGGQQEGPQVNSTSLLQELNSKTQSISDLLQEVVAGTKSLKTRSDIDQTSAGAVNLPGLPTT